MKPRPPLKVAVDASWFGPAARGMARHARTLLASDLVAPVLLNGGIEAEGRWPSRRHLPQPIFEQFSFYRAARRQGVDMCLSPYNTSPIFGKKSLQQITVIHDLIYMEEGGRNGDVTRGTTRQKLGRMYRKWVVPHSARRATAVVTVSNIMKEDLVRRFSVDPGRIFVVPNAADDDLYTPYSVQFGTRVRLLAVSGTAPHKNLARLLKCADQLIREGLPLDVDVVGVSRTEGNRMLHSLDMEARAFGFTFHRGIGRERLHSLYRRASFFVMPSLAEGFGIPLLEALAAGLPCAASEIPIFREIAGEECNYFDPASTTAIADALGSLVVGAMASRESTVARRPSPAAMRFSAAAVSAVVDDMWLQLQSP